MSYFKQHNLILETMAQFPAVFGLRAFPGRVFRINPQQSYISGVEMQLAIQVQRASDWVDFGKGTPAELRAQLVPLAKEGQ